ncbi:MAG: hypothetical protein PHP92_05595 [Candidatus Nanoarchaeia archaeon]|nr:hypothetical protein [Candidatus Nanoarchaeia archaeon]
MASDIKKDYVNDTNLQLRVSKPNPDVYVVKYKTADKDKTFKHVKVLAASPADAAKKIEALDDNLIYTEMIIRITKEDIIR